MRAATLFSGIGAPEHAKPDWQWLWHAEIEPFPAAVMAARHPGSINLGDVLAPDFAERAIHAGRPDVLVFGSPCQSFSVAGKRAGLADPRGNLALAALALVERLRPSWFVFENVPGLLSSWSGAEDCPDAVAGQRWQATEDSDFAAFLGAVRECGYSGAWRVLDAQHWGLAQRRERVFFVGSLGDWRGPAAVLSLGQGLRGYPETSREAREDVAPTLAARTRGGGGLGTDVECDGGLIAYGGNNTAGPIDLATAVNAHGGPHGRLNFESETFVTSWQGGSNQDQFISPEGISPTLAFSSCHHGGHYQPKVMQTHPLDTDGYSIAVAFAEVSGALHTALNTANGNGNDDRLVLAAMQVRRLTPRECARLQGFPDDYCAIQWRGKPAADGPMYRAYGNSMAVPVLSWLLNRIEAQASAMEQAA